MKAPRSKKPRRTQHIRDSLPPAIQALKEIMEQEEGLTAIELGERLGGDVPLSRGAVLCRLSILNQSVGVQSYGPYGGTKYRLLP